jgi:hypothetical protein
MTTRNRHGRANLQRLFNGLEGKAERLEFGDNESVLAWFRHHYPDVTGRVVNEQRWQDFVGLVRELYENEPDA